MKVIGINGSVNERGNTYLTITAFFDELHKEGIETELIQIGDGRIPGCIACRGCEEKGECIVPNEEFKELSAKLVAADGVFLAAPVYFGTMPGQMKAFLDRFFFQCIQTGRMRHKVGASMAILRRSGAATTLDDLNRFFCSAEMIIVTAAGFASIHGARQGEVLQDAEGLGYAKRLARNMAWVLKMQEATKSSVAPPPHEKKQTMNFIR